MEAYPLITNEYNVIYSEHCDETCYFDENLTGSIVAEIIDASVTVESLIYSTVLRSQASDLREQAKYSSDMNKVNTINQYNTANNLRWIADYNDIVGKWYFEKKQLLGEKFNYMGFDYYHTGIYETVFTIINPVTTNFPNYFDWRNRHDANLPDTPYFDNDDTFNTGWISPIKDQAACGTCWAFATTASVETVSNLYFNIPDLDLNLSEQELFSCVYNYGCIRGGFAHYALNYIRDSGIDNEECFKYESPYYIDCNSPEHCADPEYVTNISGYLEVDDSDLNNILESLITNGPLIVSVDMNGNHFVSLIGYYYDEQNSQIYWLIENSWGTDSWGDNGVGWVVRNYSSLVPYSIVTPIIVNFANPNNNPDITWDDADGDGIFWWGIGDMPVLCPGNPYNPDCNDNNPGIGGYDANYNCLCIMPYQPEPIVIDNFDQTWSGDDQYIDCDIEIESGYTLTIQNTIKFTDNARIIVKRGAKLVVDGGYLTNLCNNMWKGIEVWGTSNLPQDEYGVHGIVELYNGAVIENALIGIDIVRKSNPNNIPQVVFNEYSGGIVYAHDVTIKNCKTGIWFWPYPYAAGSFQENSFSTFTNVEFIVDQDYIGHDVNEAFNAMIYLNQITGIVFNSITLSNQNYLNGSVESELLGYGIYANNSGFKLCKEIDNNIIENFNYGIFSVASQETNNFISIKETDFVKNNTGIYFSHPVNTTSPSEIVFNNFDINPQYKTDNASGIYLDNTISFHIEENSFAGNYAGLIDGATVTYGIVIND